MSRGRAFVGTSGFAYAGWAPRFYPEGVKSKDLLRAYARRLRSVEVNYTFNALPTEKALSSWAESTPEDFRFALKASRRITHDGLLREADPVAYFLGRTKLLGPRLGCVLYQTPPWLRRDDDRLRSFLALLPEDATRAAFEFRHPSWYEEPVYALLRERNAALVTAEGEKAPAPLTVTGSFVYVRLRQKEAAYSDEALNEWRERIVGVLDGGRDAYVYLYHDESGENAVAATRLAEALG